MQPQNCEEFEGLVEFVVEMEFRRLNDIQIFITKSIWREYPRA